MSTIDRTPTLLALDFDGVVCNGLVEYFQTAWKAYCLIANPRDETPPPGLAESFYRLRPVVETGWEMPVVLHARLGGIEEGRILQHWPELCRRLVAEESWAVSDLAEAVDGVRDRWIAEDLEGWLSLHRFYPGVVERLQRWQSRGMPWVIITTKEGRFVRSLLQQQGVTLAEGQLFGKEVKRPKYEILRDFVEKDPQSRIWFVEDRLKTLQLVASQGDLSHLRLYLADWGYNTEGMRQTARGSDRVRLLSLSEFDRNLAEWP
ncbi:HAD family hydrolase [Baaleninema sp.]|uniref:HAD family hydrolase n=1 Tax=Baaleninema sp. TaxID=3101197 RepID=UPI003D02835F